MHFTQAQIHAFMPPIGKADHEEYDDGLTGFGVRYRNGGEGSYFIKWKTNGKTERRTIGKIGKVTLKDAQAMAKRLFGEIAQGQNPAQEHRAAKLKVSFGELVEGFVAFKRQRCSPHYLRDMERSLRSYFEPLHSLAVNEIARREVAGQLTRVASEHGTTAAARASSHLSSFFTWAIKEGLLDHSPATLMNTQEPVARERVLSGSELVKLWEALGQDDYGDVVRLLMLTGLRRNEIGGLRFSEINVEKEQIELPGARTKSGKQHIVPLSRQALAILKTRQPRAGHDFVFGSNIGYTTWSKPKTRLDAALQMGDWRLHDLRRSISTTMHEHGVEPHVVEMILGHIQGGVAGIYNHAQYLPQRKKALQDYADHISKIRAEARGLRAV